MTVRAALGVSLLLFAQGVGSAATPPPGGPGRKVLVARIDTPIHPAAANYLKKVPRAAGEERAALVVV